MADLKQLQQQRERSKKSTKKASKGGWIWIVFVVIALLANLDTYDLERSFRRFRYSLMYGLVDVGELLAPIVCVIVIVAVVLILRKAVKRHAEGNGQSSAAARTSAAVQRLDPRSKSFTRPETYCALHDHSGEDYLAHDKARRIAQLDEWLKNGLIERDEYRILKARYEQDI